MKRTRSRRIRRRGISRIDQPSTRTHGWYVRTQFHDRPDGTNGPRHQKFFGDYSHGGKRKALQAAREFLARVEAPRAGKAKRRKPRSSG